MSGIFQVLSQVSYCRTKRSSVGKNAPSLTQSVLQLTRSHTLACCIPPTSTCANSPTTTLLGERGLYCIHCLEGSASYTRCHPRVHLAIEPPLDEYLRLHTQSLRGFREGSEYWRCITEYGLSLRQRMFGGRQGQSTLRAFARLNVGVKSDAWPCQQQ